MSAIFISHSSADNEAASKLADRLEQQGHHSVFLDDEGTEIEFTSDPLSDKQSSKADKEAKDS